MKLTRSVFVLYLFILLAPLWNNAFADRAEFDQYDIDDAFIPETKRQKLAYSFNLYVSSTIQKNSDNEEKPVDVTSAPCDRYHVRYFNGFGKGTYDNVDIDPSTATPDEYKNALFSSIHWIQYRPGEKFYLIPIKYAFVDKNRYIASKINLFKKENKLTELSESKRLEIETGASQDYYSERDLFKTQYPKGEVVGYVRVRAQLIKRPIDITNKFDKKIIESKDYYIEESLELDYPHEENQLVDYYATMLGSDLVKPVLFQKKWGQEAKTYIAYENCFAPTMHYLDEDYSDLNKALTNSINSNLFFAINYGNTYKGIQDYSVNYSRFDQLHERPPVEMGYWLSYQDLQNKIIENIDKTELYLNLAKTPAYFVPFVGTGLSIADVVACNNQVEKGCFLDSASVGADVIRDASVLLKLAGPAKVIFGVVEATRKVSLQVKGLNKYAKYVPEAGLPVYLTGLENLSVKGTKLAGILDSGLAAFYAAEGDILNALGRGFSGAGTFVLLKKDKEGILPIPVNVKGDCPYSDPPLPGSDSDSLLTSTYSGLPDDAVLEEVISEADQLCECLPPARNPTFAGEAQEYLKDLTQVTYHQGSFNRVKIYRSETSNRATVIKTPLAKYGDQDLLARLYVEAGNHAKSILDNVKSDVSVPGFNYIGHGDYSVNFVKGRILSRSVKMDTSSGPAHPDRELYAKMQKAIKKLIKEMGKKYPWKDVKKRSGGTYRLYKVHDSTIAGSYYLEIDSNPDNFLIGVDGKITWIDPFMIYGRRANERLIEIAGNKKTVPLALREEVVEFTSCGQPAYSSIFDFTGVRKLPDGRSGKLLNDIQPFATGHSYEGAYFILKHGVVEGKGQGVMGNGLYAFPRNTLGTSSDVGLEAAKIYAEKNPSVKGVVLIGSTDTRKVAIANLAFVDDNVPESFSRGLIHFDITRGEEMSDLLRSYSMINIDATSELSRHGMFDAENIMVLKDDSTTSMSISKVLVQKVQFDSNSYVEMTPAEFIHFYETTIINNSE